MTTTINNPIFDYRALRLLVGLIALSLPFLVSLLATNSLSSISASYYTEARDAFIGMLFVIGAFLWAYNGHTFNEGLFSKIASIAAIFIAIFPTAATGEDDTLISHIHLGASIVLFSILAYFCFGPFRKNTKGKPGKKGLRSNIYLLCGWVMVISLTGALIAKMVFTVEDLLTLQITYWAEAISLSAFGVAWIVAGKYIPFLVDDDEALVLFGQVID